MDDEHCMSWSLTFRALNGRPADPNRQPYRGEIKLQDSSDWLGRGRMAMTGAETPDWAIDRDLQRNGKTEQGFTGLQTINVQDRAIQWAQGTMPDRSQEHLGPTDGQIIRVRHRLVQAAKALRDHGTVPPGVDEPHVYLQRSGWTLLPRTADYWAETEERRREPAVRRAIAPEITVS
jgi:hypothetical protein